MSVSVTLRRMDDAYQPQPPLPHSVTPPSPDASAGAHSAFSSSSSHQTLAQQRRQSKPVEEHKQADPQLVSRMSSTSTISSYSSSSLSSNAQPDRYQPHIHDTSHHAVVSFAPLAGITAMHAAPHHQQPTQSPPSASAHLNVTASTASPQSTSSSYLPPQHLVHAHSDTEEEGEEEGGEESGAVGEEGEYEDEEEDDESVDDSPRDGRILTFADEHGVQLCAFHVYDPNAIQNVTPRVEKQAGTGGGGGGSGGESDRRKEGGGKVARAGERAGGTDAEANCQCCIS